MKPTPLDEFPVHQTPLPMAQAGTSDRNFYDRYYFNAHDRTGEVFLVTGFGVYPNLGVVDAFATVRHGDTQRSVRFSDALEARSLQTTVGGYRIEVIDPLRSLRLICEHPDLSMDMTWEGSFEAVLEDRHVLLEGTRAMLDASRFAQVGSWSGTLSVDGLDFSVDPNVWLGTRDRSWGIRPSGESDPPGRWAAEPREGFWWTYIPLRFDDYAMVIILQESPDGHRTLNHASRVFADGRIEQLGWPRMEVDYRSGTRHPECARLNLITPRGEALLLEFKTLGGVPLSMGAGYVGDPAWSHGRWMGRDWCESVTYDMTSPDVVNMLPFNVVDHVARATCNGDVGWGLFEHANMGRHDPSGFSDWGDMAE
ncbi:hypothetical protein ACQR3Q_16935 [Dietzia natronolimnaea]|uniref:hypothetical protein n=1 Tax=Dietzia natronolimnaea TaxID=161920 RepID=UPI003D117CB1